MPLRKITKKISEIGKYFENREEKTISTLPEPIKGPHLTPSKLGISAPHNALYRVMDKLLALVHMPFLEVGCHPSCTH